MAGKMVHWPRYRAAALAVLLAVACADSSPNIPPADFLFVAVEEGGEVVVIDASSTEVLYRVPTARIAGRSVMSYSPHNVQGSPDGRGVWVTAPRANTTESGGHGHQGGQDELLRLDVATMTPSGRIALGPVHPAHVVTGPDVVYVSCTATDQVLVLDAETGAVERSLDLATGTSPHGLRLTPDGRALLVAGMGHGSLELIRLADGTSRSYPLPRRAFQVAVLPDGSAAFAGVFDTQQIAHLDLTTDELELWNLPEDAVGPVQLYPTPDSRSIWVADQGMLEGRPVGSHVYRLDVTSGLVDREVVVGGGPHGIVVDPNGDRVFVTLAAAAAVATIDAEAGEVIALTEVGRRPNGISFVFPGGAMP